MKFLFRVLSFIVLAIVAAGLFVRLAPITPADWHIDPLTAEVPAKENHYLLRPEGGDGPAPVFEAGPAALAAAFQDLIGATPRAEVIAGSAAAGHMTVLVRSRLVGFPDFVTVKVLEADGGTALAVFSRSKYGYSDLGVNKQRVDSWLEGLNARLRP